MRWVSASLALAATCVATAWATGPSDAPVDDVVSQPSATPPVPVQQGHGVDVSFPIHHALPAGTFQRARYDDFMNGCARRYARRSCESNERARKQLNLVQPPTQRNYTKTGFAHLRLDDEVFSAVTDFFRRHHDQEFPEQWPAGNTYTNHWEQPTFMISLEDRRLREGLRLKQRIWDGVKPVLEEWTGQRLRPSSLYGIRVYKEGAILAPHVDRLPLVTSAIIQVDQDTREPWPVEVYDHDGFAHNVTMRPGDVVLYESHTVVHGRPAPLNGSYYANIFVHFMPVDEEGNDLHVGSSEKLSFRQGDKGGHEHDQHDNEELQRHDDEHNSADAEALFATGSTPLHVAAAQGDVATVSKLLQDRTRADAVNEADMNSWYPIHEAARGGHLAVVKALVENGADVGAQTLRGGTPLWWARHVHGDGHAVVSFLESIGAPDLSESDEL